MQFALCSSALSRLSSSVGRSPLFFCFGLEFQKIFYMVFELCKGGDLLDKVVSSEFLSETMAAFIFK